MAPTTVAELALELLEEASDGTLEWSSQSLSAIGTRLKLEFDAGAGELAVEALLRLMSVLRNRRRSGAAADALAKVIRLDGRGRSIAAGRRGESCGIDALREFADRQGRVIPIRAARIDTPGPAGTVPVRSFIDPGRDQRARILQGAKR